MRPSTTSRRVLDRLDRSGGCSGSRRETLGRVGSSTHIRPGTCRMLASAGRASGSAARCRAEGAAGSGETIDVPFCVCAGRAWYREVEPRATEGARGPGARPRRARPGGAACPSPSTSTDDEAVLPNRYSGASGRRHPRSAHQRRAGYRRGSGRASRTTHPGVSLSSRDQTSSVLGFEPAPPSCAVSLRTLALDRARGLPAGPGAGHRRGAGDRPSSVGWPGRSDHHERPLLTDRRSRARPPTAASPCRRGPAGGDRCCDRCRRGAGHEVRSPRGRSLVHVAASRR